MKRKYARIVRTCIVCIGLLIMMVYIRKINLSYVDEESGTETECNNEASYAKWILAQYTDDSGNQSLFYTLYNECDGTLIVVDGGWDVNAQKVRNVIEAYGGHVTAWFITHYHNDHVGAFNEIFQDLQGITIDMVYDSPMNWDEYQEIAQDWDYPQYFEKYLSITKNSTNVTHLNRGDVLNIDGLTVNVFSTYDGYTLQNISGDIPNNASLMFKISGIEDSVLFCGDCYNTDYAKCLIENYGDELQSEYVQLGHHGNNSFPTSFYDVVDPKVAFFDAPEWLMIGEGYNADELNTYLIDKKTETYDYRTGDHYFDFY